MDVHHFVRSGWEHNIARILQWCQLDYDYECHSFDLSNGTIYTPDFYVYADDTYYEVKGEMREHAWLKINLFKKDHPDKKLIIIDGKIYKDLLKQFPNINFNLHIDVRIKDLNSLTQNVTYNCNIYANIKKLVNYFYYRHDNIQYKSWELNYEFYTNKRYIDGSNDVSLMNIKTAAQQFSLSESQIRRAIKHGLLNYYIVQNHFMLNINDLKSYKKYNELRREYNYLYNVAQNQKQLLPRRYQWLSGRASLIQITNEAEKNIALILEFKQIPYTYYIQYINGNKQYCGFIINKTYYILAFCRSLTRHTSNRKEIQEQNKQYKVTFINKFTYSKLILRYKQFINYFIINKFKLVLKEDYCVICNKRFIGKLDRKYCTQHINQTYLNEKAKLDKKHLNSYNQKSLNKRLNLVYNGTDIINISWFNIPIEDKNLMLILQHLKIEFNYEVQYIYDEDDKIFIFKFYLPVDQTFYFIRSACSDVYYKRYHKYIKNNSNFKCIEITYNVYNDLLQKYNFLPFANKPINLDDINNQLIKKCCLNCSNEFVVKRTESKFNDFCSLKCGEEYQKRFPQLIKFNRCKYCNKSFYYKSKRIRNFCSEKCMWYNFKKNHK